MNYLSKKYKEDENFRLILKILFIWLCSRLFMLILMLIYDLWNGADYSVYELINKWDAKRYFYIVENGYTFPNDCDPQANWAFFPVYVLICMFFKTITFGTVNTYLIGMAVSNTAMIAASFYAVKLMADSYGKKAEKCLLTAVLMLAGPYTFYMASMYTEGVFILFIVMFFYYCSKKRYLAAGVMSALASGTRIVGCLLVFALIIEIYRGNSFGKLSFNNIKKFVVMLIKKPVNLLSILICPLGTYAYMFFLRFFCGDVWAFKNVQIAWREDIYVPVVGVLWNACAGKMEPRYTYMGWMCLGIIALYIYMFVKKRYSMAVFGLLTLAVALTSHVMSTLRFTVGTFVYFVGMTDLLNDLGKKHKALKWGVLAFFAVAETVLLWMWYMESHWLM